MRFLTTLLRQKRRSATKKNGVSLIHVEKFTLPEPHIIWKWVHPTSSNQPPKLLLEVKNSEYLTFRANFLQQKWRSATRKNYVQLINLEFLSDLDTYFLGISAHGLLKVATKSSFGGKLSKKIAFLGCFFEGKTEK